MEERRFNPLMLVTLLHIAGCAQLTASVDGSAPRADALVALTDAPWDAEEATKRGAEVAVDADVFDGAAGDHSDEGEVSEGWDGDERDADLLPDADADLTADAPCEAGSDRCGTRLCAPGPCDQRAARPLAPIAALRLHNARPWFRWELPTGADGARLEVCASARCDHVEHAWEVDGARFRPPVALSQGVHFWRLTARRGGRFATVAGPAWAFAVDLSIPTQETTMARRDALLDVNGDGVEEVVEGAVPDLPRRSWTLDLLLSGTTPPVRQRFAGASGFLYTMPGARPQEQSFALHGIYPIGDVNGDGYGDLLLVERRTFSLSGDSFDVYLHLGGRDGLVGARQRLGGADGSLGMSVGAVIDVAGVGDVNGDGYGDAYMGWRMGAGEGQLLVGGAERRRVRRDCYLATSWIGHGDVNADGYEDVITGLLSAGACHAVFRLHPGGPDADQRAHCGVVASSSGVTTTLSLPPLVFAHVFDEDGDGYDDVVTIDYSCVMLDRGFSVFRGGPAGVPFTDLWTGP
ncbi:MAG: VCBS repeat-containing protein [Polyangiales bacterium]